MITDKDNETAKGWHMRRIVVAAVLVTLGWTVGPQVFAQFGASIRAPQALNTNAGTDAGDDANISVATDGSGTWVAVWWTDEPAFGGGIDTDVLIARSTDKA